MQKAVSIFTNLAGALLLAVAAALFLINQTCPADSVQPHDPIFIMPINVLVWIIGGVALAMALICFFSEHPMPTMLLLAWLATVFLVYRVGLFYEGCHSLTVFLGGFAHAFGISAKAANTMANVIWVYLLAGSYASVFWLQLETRKAKDYLKMSCPVCGGHIKFHKQNTGQKIQCPHCQASVTLRRDENLRMSCFFCKEHIEFPPHALGQKIKCPHCENDITLKEPAMI